MYWNEKKTATIGRASEQACSLMQFHRSRIVGCCCVTQGPSVTSGMRSSVSMPRLAEVEGPDQGLPRIERARIAEASLESLVVFS